MPTTVVGARPRQDNMTIGFDTTGQVVVHPTGVVSTMTKTDLVTRKARLVAQRERIDDKIAALDASIATVTKMESDLTAEDISSLMSSFIPWAAPEAVSVGMLRKHGDTLYKCIQSHTTQADWTPDATPALWLRVVPAGVIPNWVQPTGAHDAYKIGDQVVFEGGVWESKINANVWSPAAYPAGWTRIREA